MKIAIHSNNVFSRKWIEYCEANQIEWKSVNCYKSDIIQQISDCDAVMWHFHHAYYADNLFAKQLLFAIESSGKKVFPNFHTGWHFDDKIGQKYLLESFGAPLVPSYIFYSKEEAIKWLKDYRLPVVFKLRNGASSENVKLIKSKKEGIRLISKAFNKGFKYFNSWNYFKERVRKYSEGQDSFSGVLKGFYRIIVPSIKEKRLPRQRGYAYFQDFLPGNQFDVRLIVIGNKAYGMKRLVRKNDFRASGSSKFVYDSIGEETLRLAFNISRKLKLQAAAFDFIYQANQQPMIVEISCFFGVHGSSKCPGYWDEELNWHQGTFNPYGWMVETLVD